MRNPVGLRALAATVALLAWPVEAWAEDPVWVRAPMVCSRGPDAQTFQAHLTLPAYAPAGSTYTIRVESAASAKISGTGLRYLHDMVTEYALPPGATYVMGSARVVDDTGSENVRTTARASFSDGRVRLELPARVDNGSAYTPPTLEFQVRATAAPGSLLGIQFVRHSLSANVFLLGNLDVVCTPRAGSLTIGSTRVTEGPAAP